MTGTPTRYVVLLRGVNLGRARQVDMARLRDVLSARGHTDVRTHLRSGNAVLSSALAEPELVEDVAAAMRQEFGFDVQVVVRTGRELAEVVAADPLGAVATDPARYLVTFLPARPTPPGWPPLPRAELGEYRVVGRELYQWLPEGIQKTPMAAWPWDDLLGQPGTARNWNTVRRLAELAA